MDRNEIYEESKNFILIRNLNAAFSQISFSPELQVKI